MSASVCVLTARGMAAIASVGLKGGDAPGILGTIFRTGNTAARSAGGGTDRGRSARPHPGGAWGYGAGQILHGYIVDGQTCIDEVVVGCEAADTFVIHCHGNPLLVEQIVKLCRSQGAALVQAEQFFSEVYHSRAETLIEVEARGALQTCATLAGAKIIANQLTVGLLPTVRRWLASFETMSLQQLWGQCHQVLRKTSRAKFFLTRGRSVLVGPPNSGKSTLLNRLAGREEVIVTDTAGTTRDWVKITCRVGPLLADIYDTAGLDAALPGEAADTAAQATALQLVRSADMTIFVYDVTREHQAQSLLFSLGGFKGIIAANKCDLLTPHQRDQLYSKYVPLCAKTGDGIELLIQRLLAALKVADYDRTAPVCFTDRQLHTLRQILHTRDKPTSRRLLVTLLFADNIN